MYRKAYIIVIDKKGLYDKAEYKPFHMKLTKAKGILNWWHYLETTYIVIVKSTISSSGISKFVTNHLPDKQFFVCELNLEDYGGLLPEKAWDWIERQINLQE